MWKKGVSLGVLTIFCLLLAVPAGAVTVSADRRPPRVAHYDRAARELGLREWPPYFQNDQGFHVFIRLRAEEVNYSLWLPPTAIPAPRLRAEANRLAREMGWSEGEVFTGLFPWGISLRGELKDVSPRAGMGRRQHRLDMAALERWARPLGLAAGWVALRCDEGRILRGDPPPLRGWTQNQDFAFYTPATLPRGAVTIRYGLSDRWLAAIFSWAALWILFPAAALLAARRHIRGVQRMPDMDRLLLFRRWQGATVGATVGTALLTSIWLFMMPAGYLFGRLSPLLFAVSWLGVSALVGLQGRLIGLPLERAAEPEKEHRPWYRAALGELLGTLAGAGVLVAFLWLFTQGRGTWVGGLALPVLIGAIVVVVAGALVAATVNWWLTRRAFMERLEPAAPELGDAVRELSARLGSAEPKVLISRERLTLTYLKDGRVALPGDLFPLASWEQAAGLAVAEAIYQQRQQDDRAGRTVMAVFVGALVLLGIQAFAAVLLGGKPLVALWLLLPVLFPMAVLPVSRRWARIRSETDLQVADAFENPRDFLAALERLEELQTAKLDPAVREQATFTLRRRQLQKKLGLD